MLYKRISWLSIITLLSASLLLVPSAFSQTRITLLSDELGLAVSEEGPGWHFGYNNDSPQGGYSLQSLQDGAANISLPQGKTLAAGRYNLWVRVLSYDEACSVTATQFSSDSQAVATTFYDSQEREGPANNIVWANDRDFTGYWTGPIRFRINALPDNGIFRLS